LLDITFSHSWNGVTFICCLKGVRDLNVAELPKHHAYVWVNGIKCSLVNIPQLRLRHTGSETTDGFGRLLKSGNNRHDGTAASVKQPNTMSVPVQRTSYVPL